jgi:hypothetical protein
MYSLAEAVTTPPEGEVPAGMFTVQIAVSAALTGHTGGSAVVRR